MRTGLVGRTELAGRMGRGRSACLDCERGYAMAALLVAMTVMSIMLGAALPAWRTYAQREKEAELVFRGEQYARAIMLFQRKYANASPPNLDVLVNERFLRKKYKDPITNDDFQIVTPGTPLPFDQPGVGTSSQSGVGGGGSRGQTDAARQGLEASRQILERAVAGRGQSAGALGAAPGSGLGIIGVTSKSPLKSFRLYQGRDTYNQWVFMGVQQSARAGGAGGAAGQTGRGGRGTPDGRGTGRGVQQGPGRGISQPPPGRGTQPPSAPGRGFGTRNFEN